jgi:hypothetical protein
MYDKTLSIKTGFFSKSADLFSDQLIGPLIQLISLGARGEHVTNGRRMGGGGRGDCPHSLYRLLRNDGYLIHGSRSKYIATVSPVK